MKHLMYCLNHECPIGAKPCHKFHRGMTHHPHTLLELTDKEYKIVMDAYFPKNAKPCDCEYCKPS
jgi:hypothetical protein